MPSSPGIGMHVEVKDPDDKVVLSRVNIIICLHSKTKMLFFYFIKRCTVLKEDLLSHHTHQENISFACTQTAPNGFLVHSWYVARNLIGWFRNDDISISRQRVHLDIHVGEQTMDYAGIAQKEKLTELQLRVRQLLAQVDQINKEQNYQRVSCLYHCVIILVYTDYCFFVFFLQITSFLFRRFNYVLTVDCRFARRDSDRQARAPINEFSGGRWLKRPFSWWWVLGRWDISRNFSKPRNSSKTRNLIVLSVYFGFLSRLSFFFIFFLWLTL